jgi:hypothetical protein
VILVASLIVSILIGYARRGRLTGIVRSGLRGFWLIIAAFALESSTGLLARWFPTYFPEYIWIEILLQYGLLFTFILLNGKRWDIMLMGLGILLNFLVIIVNGGRMPVSQDILDIPAFAGTVERIQSGAIPEYVIMKGGEPLWFLGDVIYVPIQGAGYGSVGDFILAAGLFLLVQSCMVKARPRHVKGGARLHEPSRSVASVDGGRGSDSC